MLSRRKASPQGNVHDPHRQGRRLSAIAVLGLGMGIAISATLGPLLSGMITFHVSDSALIQLIGGESISLILAAPIAIGAGILWQRGHWLAPVLAIGPAGYAVYMYVQYIVGPQYDRYSGNNEYYFPLYMALILLGGVIIVRAWTTMSRLKIPLPSPGILRGIAILMLAFNTILAIAWAASIVGVLKNDHVLDYRADPSLFWTIRLMDLGFVIPGALTAGVALLRKTPWAAQFGLAFLGFQMLLAAAVSGMAICMKLRADPAADLVLLIIAMSWTVGAGMLYCLWLHQVAQHKQSAPDAVSNL